MMLGFRLLNQSKYIRNNVPKMCFSAKAKHITLYHDKIDAARTEYRVVDQSARKSKKAIERLEFGRTFTDHMLVVDWNSKTGWTTPLISEFSSFNISPASLVLHYGIECFEGMKAYIDKDQNIRLFRPDLNMKRMNNSMNRLALPDLDEAGFLECIKQLLVVDKSWIPSEDGYSLYIRPTAIGTSPYLGVQAPNHAKLFCILSPVGPYYKSGFSPVRLLADDVNKRAFPGGVGNVKVGGNYAPTIKVSRDAADVHDCHQVLWLSGDDHKVTEVGAMNILFIIRNKEDPEVVDLITAPLDSGEILPGVTRDSILSIARTWCTDEYKNDRLLNNIKVSEREITMGEVIEASKDGRLMEIFACGTAAIVCPVASILYKNEVIVVPTGTETAGPITTRLWKHIIDIQYGRIPDHPWSVVINEDKLL